MVIAVAMLVATAALLGACGSGGDDYAVLSIDQALKVENSQTVKVEGTLIATPERMVLASVVLESYPPQAGGSTLVLEGLDLASVVGLSSTAGQPDMAEVTWSDFPLVLEGAMSDGTLQVTGIPPVVETVAGSARVRFSPGSEPQLLDGIVWWVFEVTNTSGAAFDLTFPSGQMGDLVFSQGGAEKYRWSIDKTFLQSVQVHTLQPGASMTFVLTDTLVLAPGVYDVKATVAASAGPEDSGTSLPEIETTITLR